MRTVYLASKSPRRRELLEQIGVAHQLVDVHVDETPRPGEPPRELVTRLARDKAQAGAAALADKDACCVLGADTIVVCDDRIMGKPKSTADALAMLALLSGREHEVMTAAALAWSGKVATRLSISRVRFRELTEADRQAYCRSSEPMDKAGAYGIQGLGGLFVTHLDGSYYGVMGLALHHVEELLKEAGVEVLAGALEN